MISSLPGNPKILVFDAKFHHQILRGSPGAWASNKGGVKKFSDFLAFNVNISKTVADRAKLLLMTNKKSYMGFQLIPRSMTLDDLEVL